MFRILSVVLCVLAAFSNAQFEEQFADWHKDVRIGNHATYWPPREFAPQIPSRDVGRDVEAITERDREPLGDELDAYGSSDSSDMEESHVPQFPSTDNEFFHTGLAFGYPGFGSFGPVLVPRKHWWQGPNVCMERENIDEDDKEDNEDSEVEEDARHKIDHAGSVIFFSGGEASFESCSETRNKYTCTKRRHTNGKTSAYSVTYKCCYGYRRLLDKSNKPGCNKIQLKPVQEILEQIGANDFLQWMKMSGLEEKLSADNLTLFVPSNDAFKEYEKLTQHNQVDYDLSVLPVSQRDRKEPEGQQTPRELVLSHVTPGFIDLSDVVNEQILYSDNANNTIRLNVYPKHPDDSQEDTDELEQLEEIVETIEQQQREEDGAIVTANCARIQKKNLFATNGIVHSVEKVLTPVTNNIMEILVNHGEFTILTMVLEKTGLDKLLKDKGSITLFAPNDKAFENLDPSIRNRIINGGSCTTNIIRNHILTHTLCSCAVPKRLRLTTHNIEGDVMTLEMRHPSEENQVDSSAIVVNNAAEILKADFVAKNGVIHMVDHILLPESARPISSQLEHHNFTKFHSLLKDANLLEKFDDFSHSTVFVPNDASLNKPEISKLLSNMSKEELSDFLNYHVTMSELQSCDMVNIEDVPSAIEGKNLKIKLYSTLPIFKQTYNRATANCARILHHDIKSCGTLVHEIDRPLLPPTRTIMEIVEKDPELSVLKEILEGTDLQTILKTDDVTFLAPNNDAFDKLRGKDLRKLKTDKALATSILKRHIVPDTLCCSGIGYSSWPFTETVKTLSRPVVISKDMRSGDIRVGSSTVVTCDKVATNGVLHTIDTIIMSNPRQTQYMSSPFSRHGWPFF